MKRFALCSAVVLALGALTAPASAGIVPVGVIEATADGQDFDYKIQLTNASTDNSPIGTFWYAWVPGKDFLDTDPIAGSFLTPDGWKLTDTHFPNSPTNGFALQWVATDAAHDLLPGQSLVFGFKTTDTPDQVFGNSAFYPGTPVGTSFVYHAAPFSDPGVQFLVRPVPEPASISLCLLGAAGMFVALRRTRRRPNPAPE